MGEESEGGRGDCRWQMTTALSASIIIPLTVPPHAASRFIFSCCSKFLLMFS